MNKTRFVKFLLLVVAGCCFSAPLLRAQRYDWGSWTSVAADWRIVKKLTLTPEFTYRTKTGFTHTDQVRGGADLSYKINSYLKVSSGYQLIADRKVKKEIYEIRHRWRIDATGTYKLGKLVVHWRPRIQLTLYDEEFTDDIDLSRWVLRNRVGIKYAFKKIGVSPYFSYEISHRLSDEEPSGHYKNRYAAGMEWKVSKKHEIDLGYRHDRELLSGQRYLFDALSLAYTFRL